MCAMPEADRSTAYGRRRLLSVLPPDASKMITTGGGVPDLAQAHLLSPTAESEDGMGPKMKRRKSTKGWDGEELPATKTRPAEPHDDAGTSPFAAGQLMSAAATCPRAHW